MNIKKIKIIKISITCVLSALSAYLLYGTIGNFVVWLTQPRFTNGSLTTSSQGFLVQCAIYFVLLAISATALIICSIKFFRHTHTRDSQNANIN